MICMCIMIFLNSFYFYILDKQMFISISVIPWTDDRIMHTLCNLSRPLLPGENIYISINYRPISRDRIIALDDTGLKYLGDLSSIYPRVVRNGIHLCEVTGLHNKQTWSAEFLYQEPGMFKNPKPKYVFISIFFPIFALILFLHTETKMLQ